MFETNRLMILAGDTGKNWGLHEAEYCPLSSGFLFIRILTTTHRHLLQTIHTPHKLDNYNWNLNIVHTHVWSWCESTLGQMKIHCFLLQVSWLRHQSLQSQCLNVFIDAAQVWRSLLWLTTLLMFAPRWRYIASINSFTQHIRVTHLSSQWIEMNHNVCFTFDSQFIKMHLSL